MNDSIFTAAEGLVSANYVRQAREARRARESRRGSARGSGGPATRRRSPRGRRSRPRTGGATATTGVCGAGGAGPRGRSRPATRSTPTTRRNISRPASGSPTRDSCRRPRRMNGLHKMLHPQYRGGTGQRDCRVERGISLLPFATAAALYATEREHECQCKISSRSVASNGSNSPPEPRRRRRLWAAAARAGSWPARFGEVRLPLAGSRSTRDRRSLLGELRTTTMRVFFAFLPRVGDGASPLAGPGRATVDAFSATYAVAGLKPSDGGAISHENRSPARHA